MGLSGPSRPVSTTQAQYLRSGFLVYWEESRRFTIMSVLRGGMQNVHIHYRTYTSGPVFLRGIQNVHIMSILSAVRILREIFALYLERCDPVFTI